LERGDSSGTEPSTPPTPIMGNSPPQRPSTPPSKSTSNANVEKEKPSSLTPPIEICDLTDVSNSQEEVSNSQEENFAFLDSQDPEVVSQHLEEFYKKEMKWKEEARKKKKRKI